LLSGTAAAPDAVAWFDAARRVSGAGAWVRARPSSRPLKVVRDVVFTQGSAGPVRLDLTLPAGTPPAGGWPVVVAIHGGGWKASSREAFRREFATPLAALGYAVVTPDYTPSTPIRPSWPENFDDVGEAVRWARRNARRYRLDPDRIAALGWSSGGHLAALLGTDPEGLPPSSVSARVSAVVDLSGPADLATFVADPSADGAGAAVQMLGGRPDQLPARYADASPVTHASTGDAPTLIIHGLLDEKVPADQSRELAGALAAAGVEAELVLLPDADHVLDPFGRADLAGLIASFLSDHLPPTRAIPRTPRG
jgi:acetyl esterase/lipase